MRRLLAAALTIGIAQPLAAQAGPFIPVGSRLDRAVTWSIAEGVLPAVDPLTRPYRFAAVRAALARADTTALSAAGRRSLAWLSAALPTDSSALVAEAGLAAYRSGTRESFRGTGRAGESPLGGIWASVARGSVVAVVNPAFENRLADDPEWSGKTDRAVSGRMQAAYIALTSERGDLLLGRTARQWGPSLFEGLQLSPSAYATEALAGTLRLGRLELTAVAQRLDDYDTTLVAAVTRWFLGHRLAIRAGRGTWIALTETGVYGGPGRGFDPALHAPLGLAMLAQFNEGRRVNLAWGAALHAPLGRGTTFEAELVFDDVQIDRDTLTDRRPWSGGFTATLTRALPSLPVHAALGYTQVRSLTYRNTADPWGVYAQRGVGLARNYADYDQLLLRVAARVSAVTSVTLDLARYRQGAGDFRQPFPSDSVLQQPDQDFLVPPVSRGSAIRLSGETELRPGIQLSGEIGTTGLVTGRAATIAALSLRVRYDLLARRFGSAWHGVEPNHLQ